MQFSDGFLEFPADQWKHQSSCNDAKNFISSIAIMNDRAEHGIALIESFSGQFTQRTVAIPWYKLLLIIAKSFLNFQN